MVHTQWVRNNTTWEKGCTALRTVRILALVVGCFKIALRASTLAGRVVFGYDQAVPAMFASLMNVKCMSPLAALPLVPVSRPRHPPLREQPEK